ncbi:hypothetical protein I314_03249 [Cryptococcus bacillisporus CA1873]|uniref:Uncharacterized protein n=2 Tax=Cryptococcus gattii TaxID=552467 RepID=A0A0D0VJT2_CRYGA|nr:hypothetical protein I312_02793 [Cryptococcus bacillisporus CA1280]KIR63843.1 hypothetical protein I314_03249 [Cryptococcus bacillisporus CA1873]|eukprot:KIR63843.1 hypothetical protein I314_03249 [Cryptococcus gattii CA1873]
MSGPASSPIEGQVRTSGQGIRCFGNLTVSE